MSTHNPIAEQIPPARGNGLGLFSFILSVLGLSTCGTLSAVSLVLSIIGLKREPRGTAVAGFILSLLGLVLLSSSLFYFLTGFYAFSNSFGNFMAPTGNSDPAAETAIEMQTITIKVGKQWQEKQLLPSQTEGDQLVASAIDGWGNPIEYQTDGTSFSIISLGADGKVSPDDIKLGPFFQAKAASEAFGIDVSTLSQANEKDKSSSDPGPTATVPNESDK